MGSINAVVYWCVAFLHKIAEGLQAMRSQSGGEIPPDSIHCLLRL